MSNQKIYYAHSIQGSHVSGEWTPQDVIYALHEVGYTVLSEEIFTENLPDIVDTQIYKRDIDMLEASDFVLANITNPSLGVGYEIGYAESIGKPVICFREQALREMVSMMITGNKKIPCFPVYSLDELIRIVKRLR